MNQRERYIKRLYQASAALRDLALASPDAALSREAEGLGQTFAQRGMALELLDQANRLANPLTEEELTTGRRVQVVGTPYDKCCGVVVWPSGEDNRPGQVAVFLPDYPATHQFWFAPHSLRLRHPKSL